MPGTARWTVMAAAALLGYGALVHVVQLVLGGTDPYPTMPVWLTVYFVSLTALDAAAAALLLLRRREGLVLACAILLTDAAANGYANYVVDPAAGLTAGRFGHAVITVLAVAMLVAVPRLWPWLRSSERLR